MKECYYDRYCQMGARIAMYRKLARLTQEQLADLADCAPSFIAQIEVSRNAPSLDMLFAIADALGVELNAYHIASDFLAAVGRQYDFAGALLGDKSNCVVFDNTKLKRLVPQMTTTVPFHEGARISLAHILSHPELQAEDPEFDAWCDRVIAGLEELKARI